MLRQFPRTIKRLVVKVGSSVIATDSLKPRMAHLQSLVDQICRIQKQDVEVLLVSSGAIVLGMGDLKLKERPKELPKLQALAAVGQAVLMKKYNECFKKHHSHCAQVLLTWDDFDKRERYNNAREALNAMLSMGAVPVINENDTIATDEIKFGDNDKLSSFVASLVQADLLIILSDVEGLYDTTREDKKVFEQVKKITTDIENIASGTLKKNISKGGMTAKLDAIKIATKAKIPCVIANGLTENVLLRVLAGETIGTLFEESEEKALSRNHWISFGAKPKGFLIVDEGAKKAILSGGKSLLLPGILSFEGHFKNDEVVIVMDKNKQEIARGIINYSTADLSKVDDKKGKLEVIHRNNLVLSEK